MPSNKTLVFSDLDGTLLDHFTYSSIDAQESIRQLKQANIPVILNTSKTQAELENIRAGLALDTPFIIENGAAVIIPKSTFREQPNETTELENFWVKSFSSERVHWLNVLDNNCDAFSGLYQGFSSLSVNELSNLTGLKLADAKMAKCRQYGEPINWLGDNETKQLFIDHMINQGANVVQGGRFIHIGDYCDKGQALIWLTERYREHYNTDTVISIALGDGENDVAMLEAADIAVQIRSPVHDFPKLSRQYSIIQTQGFGPKGWAEAINAMALTSSSENKSSLEQEKR